MKKIISYMGAALIMVGLLQPVTHVPESPVVHAEAVVSHEPQKASQPVTQEETVITTPTEETTPPPVVVPAPVIPPTPVVNDNESIIWNYLIGQGFTREQTAGIMGNLQQEHNFNTSDVAGGLGIAQWIGNRRLNLINKGNYLDINVQLDYLMEELNGTENNAKQAILHAQTPAAATVAFSSRFERCGVCMDDKRITYAFQILGRH
jgi:hypothetical protein